MLKLKENCKYALAVPTSMGVRITPPDGQPVEAHPPPEKSVGVTADDRMPHPTQEIRAVRATPLPLTGAKNCGTGARTKPHAGSAHTRGGDPNARWN